DYANAGAALADQEQILQNADIVLTIQPEHLTLDFKTGAIVLGAFQPLYHAERMQDCTERNLTVFSLDTIPRTTRAQAMDVLSSQANIAGYKAVLLAASQYSRYFPMFMTAAGSIAPAKVMILGAGVAGL